MSGAKIAHEDEQDHDDAARDGHLVALQPHPGDLAERPAGDGRPHALEHGLGLRLEAGAVLLDRCRHLRLLSSGAIRVPGRGSPGTGRVRTEGATRPPPVVRATVADAVTSAADSAVPTSRNARSSGRRGRIVMKRQPNRYPDHMRRRRGQEAARPGQPGHARETGGRQSLEGLDHDDSRPRRDRHHVRHRDHRAPGGLRGRGPRRGCPRSPRTPPEPRRAAPRRSGTAPGAACRSAPRRPSRRPRTFRAPGPTRRRPRAGCRTW